jgi:hypothetical protein
MAASKLFRYPAVAVIWWDAHARPQAVEYTEDEVKTLHQPAEVITLGLLIKEDDTGISLYSEEPGPDSVRGANFIPAGMIKEVIRLGDLKRPAMPRAKRGTSPAPAPPPA